MIIKRYKNGKQIVGTELEIPIAPPPIPLVTQPPAPVQKKAPEKTQVVNAPAPAPSSPKKGGCGCGR
jgi:hypothetical protein